MFSRSILFHALIGAGFSLSAALADATAVPYYEDAAARFAKGDIKGAEIQLRNALQHAPNQLSARILMGRVQLQLGNPREAEKALLLARDLGADAVQTAVPLARARNLSGRHKANIDGLVPTHFPRHQQPDIWVELGIARLLDGDPGGADIAFAQALEIDPLHLGSMLGMARIPLEAGDFVEAERRATVAVTRLPESAQAWFLKGSALQGQGRNRDAAAAYVRARELQPGHAAAGLGAATALLDAGKAAAAAAQLAHLREEFPWMPEAPYLHSQALKHLGQEEAAQQALRAAVDLLDPIAPEDLVDRPGLLRLAGSIAIDNGQLERAYKAISLYIAARPQEVAGRKLLARIALRMNRPDTAKRALVPIVSSGKTDAETLALLGDANARLHDFVAAESYYRHGIADYNGGAALIGRLGAIQYRQGRREQALATLKKLTGAAAAEVPAGIPLYTAMLYLAEGRLAEAGAIADRLAVEQADNLLAVNLQAAIAIAQGEHGKARQLLAGLLDKAPEFRPARYNLVKLDVIEGHYGQAEQRLLDLLAEDGNAPRTLLELARLDAARGDGIAAIQRYEQIRSNNTRALQATLELIGLYLAESRSTDAMQVAVDLNRALPDEYYAREALARVQLVRGEVADARSTLRQAAQLAGYDPRRLLRAARAQKTAGAYDDALANLAKLLRKRPDAIDARRERADVLFRQGRLDPARKVLDGVLKDAPTDVRALALRGDILLAQGEAKAAAATFVRALHADPRPELAVSLFRARTLAGEGETALADLQRWHEARSDQLPVIRALAERRHQRGEVEAAQALYERLIALDPRDATVHNNLANLLMDVDNERAFRAARRAYELAPSHPAVLDTLGWALVQIGELEEGLSHLRNSVARDGRSGVNRYHLGVALAEFGSHAESRRELAQALKLAGDVAWAADARRRIGHLD